MHALVTANLTLANRITLARFLLIPVFILLALYYIKGTLAGSSNEMLRWGALMVFCVTCLTDALDGYFARARNERTRLGTLLDPMADKSLLLSSLVLLTGPWGACFNPHIPVWYVLLVISRDVSLIAGALLIHLTVGHIDVRPRISGKLSTFFQMGLIFWVLGHGPARWFPFLLWTAAAFTLLSAFQYVSDGIRQIEKSHAREHKS